MTFLQLCFMIIHSSLILYSLALSVHLVAAAPCCFGRKEKKIEARNEPIRLYTISTPRLISSTHEIALPFTAPEDIPEVPRLQYDIISERRPSAPTVPSRLHLSARPMPFRGNTDFNRYKDEMRDKGVQHTIPTTPSDSARSVSDNEHGEEEEAPVLRTASFRSAKEYFNQQH